MNERDRRRREAQLLEGDNVFSRAVRIAQSKDLATRRLVAGTGGVAGEAGGGAGGEPDRQHNPLRADEDRRTIAYADVT